MFFAVRFCGFLFACLLAIAAARADQVPLDENGFTAFVRTIIQQTRAGTSAKVVGPLHLKVTETNGDVWDSYLYRIHDYCVRNPATCDGSVRLHVQQMAEAHKPGTLRVEASALRVVVRQSGYVAQARAVLRGKGDPIVEPLVGDLWTIAVLDMPTAVKVLKPADLEKLQLSAEEALARAKKNTKADLAERIPKEVTAANEVGVLPGDAYQASLLAFPELWASLAGKLDHRLIVAVPGTHMVLFSKDDGSEIETTLAKVAEASMTGEDRPLSAAVYRWTPKGWVELGQ